MCLRRVALQHVAKPAARKNLLRLGFPGSALTHAAQKTADPFLNQAFHSPKPDKTPGRA